MSKIRDLEVGHGDGAPAREMKHDTSRSYVIRRGRKTSAGNDVYAEVLMYSRRTVLEQQQYRGG